MSQVGLTDGRKEFIAGCPRRDCNIEGITSVPYGAVRLLPQWQYLIDDPEAPANTSAPSQRPKEPVRDVMALMELLINRLGDSYGRKLFTLSADEARQFAAATAEMIRLHDIKVLAVHADGSSTFAWRDD
jgi:hypothetical protein